MKFFLSLALALVALDRGGARVFLLRNFVLKVYGKASAILAVRFTPAAELIFPYTFKTKFRKRKTELELKAANARDKLKKKARGFILGPCRFCKFRSYFLVYSRKNCFTPNNPELTSILLCSGEKWMLSDDEL